ncbi:Uncharacterized protein PECH_006954 [Penicillium ucsense]|uniref:Uncharacterized protein n=1 Tax=Penicillium ucsense TaxID=2839758 RepID=A0A8J8WJR8_9EURO|nr:Uncharacterized protein PECM_005073 [Penicillium ucsense]KAF7738995.1 Uncharacterized protein PECH_006954 [Penicillium ucsense]
MTSSLGVYAAEPAYPILAHSLLQAPSDSLTNGRDVRLDSEPGQNWNLKDDWEQGIQKSGNGIFRCGVVVGISRLKSRSKDTDEYVGQIPRYLLTSHLLNTGPSSSETSAFIIHPNNFDALAPRLLLHALQSTNVNTTTAMTTMATRSTAAASHPQQAGLSRTDALKYLDSVQLLPVQSLPNAAQAINTVSDALQKLQDKRRSAAEPERPVVLIVAGLDTLAEAIIRASNPLRGTALLAATLRNVNRLARTHGSWLSIILVNTSGLGPAHYDLTPSVETDQVEKPRKEMPRKVSGEDHIYSLFPSPGGPLLSTLLMKTLDQGIDTHVLLSNVKAAQVAEVIKDRTGPGLGKWGIWSPRR